jgi:retinol-binding protein 3
MIKQLYWCVLTFALTAVPTGSLAQTQFDDAVRADVVNRALDALEKGYVFPDVAAAMTRAVRVAEQAGRYRGITTPAAFAEALSTDLRAVSHDVHLRVIFRGGENGPNPSGPRPNAPRQSASHKRLDGNLGYLKLPNFPPAEEIAPDINAAFKELNDTDALIIDLRDNGGGSPEGVMYLAGFLMKEKTLVARIYSRLQNDTTEMWTRDVPGPKYLNKPVYILTSRRTFSAAEAAAYHLKHLGRAKTVGDTTGGGAHRITGQDLGHGFMMSVPGTRPINVVTGGDWEGTGVIPDIAVPTERALNAAQLAALRSLPAIPARTKAIHKLEQE